MYVKYYCSYCHDDFEGEEECYEHEALCPCNPDDQQSPTPSACESCENCTAEGYYNHECKLKYAALPRHHCTDHIPARA